MAKKNVKELEVVDIVDKNDKVIRQMPRWEAVEKGERHRVVHVFLINDEDTFLVQWRASDVTTSPRTFIASAAGAVEAGETYEAAAIREMEEELGAKNVPVKLIAKFQVNSARKVNGEIYAGVWSGEAKGWENEADALDYWNRDEAMFMLKRFPYLLSNSFQVSLKAFLKATK